MNGVLLMLIRELQTIELLQHFSLAGGTNLAIRFNHRQSDDIDLFTKRIIGVAGWEKIIQALRERYKGDILFCSILNRDEGDQFCFLRALIRKGQDQIKIDMVQNVQQLDAVEKVDDINLFSVRDIGLLKLMAASNRLAKNWMNFVLYNRCLFLILSFSYKDGEYGESKQRIQKQLA